MQTQNYMNITSKHVNNADFATFECFNFTLSDKIKEVFTNYLSMRQVGYFDIYLGNMTVTRQQLQCFFIVNC